MADQLAGKPPVHQAFRLAMRRFASTVTVITAADHERKHGMTATAVSSLSMDPPSILICVNQATLMNDVLHRARRFCVNVLHHHQSLISVAFSGGEPSHQRFNIGEWSQSPDGTPYLVHAQANLFCLKVAAIPFGTHTILIGQVEDVDLDASAVPLVYHDAGYCVATPMQNCREARHDTVGP